MVRLGLHDEETCSQGTSSDVSGPVSETNSKLLLCLETLVHRFQTIFASIEGEPHCPSIAFYSYSIGACRTSDVYQNTNRVCRIKLLKHNTVATQKDTKMPRNVQVNHCEVCFPQVQLVYQESPRGITRKKHMINTSVVDKRLDLPQSSEHSWDGRHLSMT